MDMFNINCHNYCGVRDGKAARVLAYLLSHSAKERYEAYASNRMSTDAHVYH